jgi:hypothetical protein
MPRIARPEYRRNILWPPASIKKYLAMKPTTNRANDQIIAPAKTSFTKGILIIIS